MSVTVASFKAKFPEFQNLDSDLLEAHIEDAELNAEAALWDDHRDQGVELITAQSLALSPAGRSMQLESDGVTVYDKRLERLKYMVTAGMRWI